MLLRLLNTTIFILMFSFSLFSQEIGIGQWREHFTYNRGVSVASDGQKVYCATSSSVFSFNAEDNSLERMSKVNGYSDIGISKIAFNKKEQALVITYENANVDILKNQKIINVSDIKRANISGIKTINNIYFINEFAYLSCSFGIVVLDVKKNEIKDTYYIGPNGSNVFINEISSDETYLYAATNQGVFKANKTSYNLINFNEWQLVNDLPIPLGNYINITTFNNKIYTTLVIDSAGSEYYKTYYFNGIQWVEDPIISDEKIYGLNSSSESLVINYENRFEVLDKNDNISFTSSLYEGWETPNPSHVLIDDQDVFWIADRKNGLIKMYKNRDIERIIPDGPKNKDAVHFSLKENNLWVAAGAVDLSWHNQWNHNGILYFKDKKWGSIDGLNSSALDTIWDVIHININPNNTSQIFASSYGWGLIELNNNAVVNVFNEKNSTLELISGIGSGLLKVTSSAFDVNGNLWVANSGTNSLLSVKISGGTWKSFSIPGIKNYTTGNLITTKNNQKWLVLPRGEGILVYDDNGTISDENDDKFVKLGFTEGNGNIPGSDVFNITEDKNGYIWVGTDEGVGVFYNPSNVFSSSGFDAQQIKIVQDGNVQLLLETESVSCITVDGANRKWISTQKGGVFLVSEDGTELINAFNTSNSPLPSNSISHIAINDETGEVYFGTDEGIISYKSTATAGQEFYTNVYAYPNPVREDYDGLIAIKGLIGSSQIKITDVSGKLIYETTSIGGQAIWDGKNFSGEKAKTGVYLVFASNPEGDKTMVTKILLID